MQKNVNSDQHRAVQALGSKGLPYTGTVAVIHNATGLRTSLIRGYWICSRNFHNATARDMSGPPPPPRGYTTQCTDQRMGKIDTGKILAATESKATGQEWPQHYRRRK